MTEPVIPNLADVLAIRRAAVIAGLKPPPKLSLSAWADEHYRLTVESSASVGRWKCIPYQVGIMDAVTDPEVTFVTVMKSARIGWTLMIVAAVGYHIHQDPCSILFAQPTVDDAKKFSKDTIAPMLASVPVLAAIVEDEVEEKGARDAGNTIQGKCYPGGRLTLVGANSGAGFRRLSCRVFIGDEIDAWPPSAGSDGDPIKLGTKRTEYFWNRKVFLGSTPLVEGHSKIAARFVAGDQRRYYVPCPQCGHMDYLVFTKRDSGGHYMIWPTGNPDGAHFVCSLNQCVIEHKDKFEMVAKGEWRGSKPFVDHASFHIWAAYSYSPNATWAQIAKEFLEAKAAGREEFRVFVNTTLGETWKEAGDAPDWERLYQLREHYPIGTVPDGVQFITCGVDVQKDRFVYEVVGWGHRKESWSIDAGVLPADTANEADWARLNELLARGFQRSSDNAMMTILMMAVDSGYNTQMVYNWARKHERSRVIATKGVSTARTIIGSPTPVDVVLSGRRITRGYKVWPIGVDLAKAELYGWLRLSPPTDEQKVAGATYPGGYCHTPEYGEEFYRQLTAEHLVTTVKRTGYQQHEWQLIPGRENHWLDARILARVAAAIRGGLDRGLPATSPTTAPPPAAAAPVAAPAPLPLAPVAPPVRQIPVSRFWPDRGKPWL